MTLGKLTWEQALAMVDRAYDPNDGLDIHPSIKTIRIPMVSTPEIDAHVNEFMRKFEERKAVPRNRWSGEELNGNGSHGVVEEDDSVPDSAASDE